MKYSLPSLRLGGTSFLLHEHYVPAVRFTAQHCDDVALLLLETGAQGDFLPSHLEILEIKHILNGEGASAHAHLPVDAHCGTPATARLLTEHVCRAFECVASLPLHSFVLHIDFPDQKHIGEREREYVIRALEEMLCSVPAHCLCIENLEGYRTDFWDYWVEELHLSRCLDGGHIWKDGGKPELLLDTWRPALRILHVHGLKELPSGKVRDHVSLSHMAQHDIDAFFFPLWREGFSWVVTLEVFSFADFQESHRCLLASYERYCQAFLS